MKNYQNKALFLDRDGVINEDYGYVFKIENFKFKDGIFDVLKAFQEKNFLLIIITNQSGIARGYYTKNDFENLTNYMLSEFKKEGIEITKVYFCPHLENCSCRKPNPGMILKAKDEFKIDLKSSFLIGDKFSDILAGYKSEIGNLFLLGDEKDENINFHNIKNLYEMLEFIKEN